MWIHIHCLSFADSLLPPTSLFLFLILNLDLNTHTLTLTPCPCPPLMPSPDAYMCANAHTLMSIPLMLVTSTLQPCPCLRRPPPCPPCPPFHPIRYVIASILYIFADSFWPQHCSHGLHVCPHPHPQCSRTHPQHLHTCTQQPLVFCLQVGSTRTHMPNASRPLSMHAPLTHMCTQDASTPTHTWQICRMLWHLCIQDTRCILDVNMHSGCLALHWPTRTHYQQSCMHPHAQCR